jgi:hypothetical protein
MIKIAKPFIGTQHLNQRYGKKDPMYSVIGLLGHNGFDFALPIGTPVIACLDGVVLSIAEDNAIERGYPTRGIGVEILHNVGGMTFKSLYWGAGCKTRASDSTVWQHRLLYRSTPTLCYQNDRRTRQYFE